MFSIHFYPLGNGCQSTLLRMLEDGRMALDERKQVAAILMDLSKAFDCLPHDMFLSKLTAYGVSSGAVNLISSYLENRKQQVKVGPVASSLGALTESVPQGSILGSLCFNILINDIFYFLKKSTLYNYADDNTLSYAHNDCDILKSV